MSIPDGIKELLTQFTGEFTGLLLHGGVYSPAMRRAGEGFCDWVEETTGHPIWSEEANLYGMRE